MIVLPAESIVALFRSILEDATTDKRLTTEWQTYRPNESEKNEMVRMKERGASVKAIAAVMGRDWKTVARCLRQRGVSTNPCPGERNQAISAKARQTRTLRMIH